MDVLGSVVFIATGYGWTVWERSGNNNWIRVAGLGTVVGIATGYGWMARDRSVYSDWLRLYGL